MTDPALTEQDLPVGSIDAHASGWWAMLFLIASEAALFVCLLFAYFYLAVQPHASWPLGGQPKLALALPNTIILLASSAAVWWAERGVQRGRQLPLLLGLGATLLLGTIFLGVQILEWQNKPFRLASDPYASLYFTTTGFHMAHVAAGLLMLLALLVWSWLGYFDRYRRAAVSIGALYWHFVDAVWLAVFFSFYITPRLG